MKKILFAALMILAVIFVVSCSGDEATASNEAGASCSPEGMEACSQDYSQILICQDSAWQTKKTCNLNFGEYCRETVSGSYSCTDSGSNNSNDSGENTDPTDDITDPTDTEPNDNEPTDNEPEDNTEPADDNEPDDITDPTEDGEPNDDDSNVEPDDSESVVHDLETCADIVKCQSECDSANCNSECYKRGTNDAQNDFYERNQVCPTYTEINDLKHCQELYVKCGTKGDESYTSPYGYGNGYAYGHAVINGSFSHIHEAGTTSFSQGTFIDTFVTGNFGSNGNIPDPTAPSDASFSVAFLNQTGNMLILRQTYNSNTVTGKTPDVIFVIDAHSPGTYSVGMGIKDNVTMYVSENTDNEANACDHAFGYGFVELSGTGLTETYPTGAYTINIQGEVDLYSYKNAPMYVGSSNTGDITNENLVACQPK